MEGQTQDLGADEIQGAGAGHGLRGRCSADRLCNAKGQYGADRLCEADEMEVLRARAVYLEVVKHVGDESPKGLSPRNSGITVSGCRLR